MKRCNLKKYVCFLFALVILLGNIGTIKVDAADYWQGVHTGRVVLDSGTLNIRQAASTSSEIVGSLRNGDYIMLVGVYGDFFKIMYDTRGYFGYVSREFVNGLGNDCYFEPNIDSGTLNMRQAPGTNYSVVASIPKGQPFGFIADDTNHTGWYYGVYANVVGYTSKAYTYCYLFINPD